MRTKPPGLLMTILCVCFTASLIVAQVAPTPESAAAALAAGDYRKAASEYDVLLTHDRSVANLLGRAKALFHLQENGLSKRLLEEVIARDKSSSEPYLCLALIADRQGRDRAERVGLDERAQAYCSEAIDLYRRAASLTKQDRDIRLWCADTCEFLGRPREALTELSAALENSPKDVIVLAAKLRIERTLSDWRAALGTAVALEDAGDVSPATRIGRLEGLARLGRHDEAHRLFGELLAKDGLPRDVRVYGALFDAWNNDRDRARLISALETVPSIDPDDFLHAFYLARAYAGSGEWKKAEDSYRRYIAVDPSAVWPHVNLLAILTAQDRMDEAEAEVTGALAVVGPRIELIDAAQRVVQVFVDRKDMARALKLHAAIREAAPADAVVERRYAVLLKENGRLGESRTILEKLVERDDLSDEQRASFLNDLALNLRGEGKNDEARAIFERALEIDPRQIDVRENLGVMYYETGQLDEARVWLETVVRLDESRDRPRYYLRRIARAASAK